jgi:hypothetical protein
MNSQENLGEPTIQATEEKKKGLKHVIISHRTYFDLKYHAINNLPLPDVPMKVSFILFKISTKKFIFLLKMYID